MERQPYEFEDSEGSSLVIGVALMVLISSSAGLLVFMALPGSSLDSPSTAETTIQPMTGGVEITATSAENVDYLLIVCGDREFRLIEGDVGRLYSPDCDSIHVNSVVGGVETRVTSHPVIAGAPLSDDSIVVSADGSGDVRTLEAAVELSRPGDTIVLQNVGKNTQYSGSITIDKRLTIQSDSGVDIVTTPYSPLTIASARTKLEHLTVYGETTSADQSVLQLTTRAVLSDVTIDTGGPGIGLLVDDSSGRTELSNITITGAGIGLYSNQSTIMGENVLTEQSLTTGTVVLSGSGVNQVELTDSNIRGETGLMVHTPTATDMGVKIGESTVFGSDTSIDLRNGQLVDFQLQESNIQGNGDGLVIGSTNTSITGDIMVQKSAFSPQLQTVVAVYSSTADTDLLFRENWWGESAGPDESVIEDPNNVLDTTPWCTDKTCSTLKN